MCDYLNDIDIESIDSSLNIYSLFRNLLHNVTYNPSVISWVDEGAGCFKINNTVEFAATWGRMKSNRWVLEKTVNRF